MNRYFFVQRTDQVCKREEWDTLPYGFDNTWGIVKDLGLVPSTLLSFIHLFAKYLTLSVSFFFSTSICPQITDEQEAFIRRVLEIPFGERKWKDLVTLDTSHTYCDGPIPTLQPVVCFLLILASTFLTSILYPLQKWKQGGKGFSKGVVATRKQQQKEGASMLASKVVAKGTSMWKNEGKDDHPHKKGLGTPTGDKQPKQPSLPKPSHGIGKGLMTEKGLVAQGAIRRLLTHMEHVVEMVELIIKETYLDPWPSRQLTI